MTEFLNIDGGRIASDVDRRRPAGGLSPGTGRVLGVVGGLGSRCRHGAC
jgi:hypothetical protein